MKIVKLVLSAAVAISLCGTVAAKEVGRFEGPAGKLILFDDAHKCPEGSKVIAYVDQRATVPGCWFERYGFVWAFFSDGDKGVYDKKDFKWLDI